jgi:hypothetical protein
VRIADFFIFSSAKNAKGREEDAQENARKRNDLLGFPSRLFAFFADKRFFD